ncbi:MAG: hypothetical protein LBM96_09110 [Methanobrevibacter sp.]|jgi:hypothetical protein|nr:hypothetical protein [Candidatus Methanoflexus mossambicus]
MDTNNFKKKEFKSSKIYFHLRKFNIILSIVLILVVLLHGTIGSLILSNVLTYVDMKIISWLAVVLLVIHTILGIIFTKDAIVSVKGEGKWYLKQNSLFWTRRISGILIIVLLFFHISLFGGMINGQYVLYEFNIIRLIAQILLIVALFVHIFVNVEPMLSSLGIIKYKERKRDIFLILSIFLLIFTIATILYFIAWQSGFMS